MYDALFVGVVQRSSHLIGQPQQLVWCHGLSHDLGKGSGLDELHDDVGDFVFLSVINHDQYVGVAQAGDGFRFLAEALKERVILFRVVRRHHFHSHIPSSDAW